MGIASFVLQSLDSSESVCAHHCTYKSHNSISLIFLKRITPEICLSHCFITINIKFQL